MIFNEKRREALAKHKLGFTIVELFVTISIGAILVTMAKATYPAIMVYAHRAEAKNNLAHIRTLQSSYHMDRAAYVPLATVGYTGSGASACSGSAYDNTLGFRPDDCSQLRYEYSANVNGQKFEAFAYGRSDFNRRWIYPGCEGTGATQYGKSQGDLLTITHDKEIEVCRDITDYCPESGSIGSVTSKCGTPLVAGTSTPTNPNTVTGVTPVPFKPLLPPGLPPELPMLDVPIFERTPSCKFVLSNLPTGILGAYGNDYSYSTDCSAADCLACPTAGSKISCDVACGNSPRDSDGKCSCTSAPCVSTAYTGFCNTTQDPTGGTCSHNIHISSSHGSYKKTIKVSLSGDCK